ncbi:MAG: hypothetical protein AAGM84_18595, partial [Pseudomonadota bacterium]
MAENDVAVAATEKPANTAAAVSLGITVIILYAIFVSAVALGFSSYIYRAAWETDFNVFPASAGPVPEAAVTRQSLDSMVFILQREEALERAKADTERVIRDLRAEAAEASAAVNMSFAPIARARDQMRVYTGFVASDLEPFRASLDPEFEAKYAQVLQDGDLGPHGRLSALLSLTEEGLTNPAVAEEQRVAFGDFKEATTARLSAHLAEIEAANAASHKLQQERQVIRDKITEQQSILSDHRDATKALQDILPVNSVTRAQLASLRMDTPLLPDDLLLRLVSFPTIFLTLIVTIAAGGLGTVVSFSRRYYSGNSSGLTRSRLFVNVGEGIAAAIAIFLFSGAGMLALTQGGA